MRGGYRKGTVYNFWGREITIYTVIYSVNTQFWPTLFMVLCSLHPTNDAQLSIRVLNLCQRSANHAYTLTRKRNTHTHTHTNTHTHTQIHTQIHTRIHTHTHTSHPLTQVVHLPTPPPPPLFHALPHQASPPLLHKLPPLAPPSQQSYTHQRHRHQRRLLL